MTKALLVTLLVEVPIVFAFYRSRRSLLVALLMNAITNSLLNRVWLALLPWPTFALVSGELLSAAVEAWAYARMLKPANTDRAIAASALANLASFAGGPVLLSLLSRLSLFTGRA